MAMETEAEPTQPQLRPILANLSREIRRPLESLRDEIDRLLGNSGRPTSDAERAQARTMLALCDDLDRLTIFADNLVPHVLRLDGVLEYDPQLVARIEREELIPAGSPEELEIRACALHAVELLTEALRQGSEPVSAMQLDYVLWNRGQEAAYKARPRHRTRTVYY